VVTLGINNLSRRGFTLLQSHVKKLRRREEGDSRCKTARAGFNFFAKLRALMCTAERGKPQ
jgi:hypothetical protein